MTDYGDALETLRELARLEERSADSILTRELEDVASAHAEELASATPE